MTRRLLAFALLAGAAGCGGPAVNTAPLTDEQKAKVRAEDDQTADEESGGRGKKLKQAPPKPGQG